MPAKGGDAGDVGSIPGLGNPLEEEMAICSSILAWEIAGAEEPMGSQKSETRLNN